MSLTEILYLLAAIGLLALLFLIWKVPKWQTKKRKDIEEKEKWKAENEFRKTLLQVSGGLILIISLIFTWRGMNQSQKNIETGHQITRFNQAIKFLSENDITLKLGGLYTLEHIVRESPELYLGSVIEVISAFVRNAEVTFPDFETWKTQYSPRDIEVLRLYIKDNIKSKKTYGFNRWLKDKDYKNEELKKLFEKFYIIKHETQIAMTVLGRIRTDKNKNIWEKLPMVNLNGTKLMLADLMGANLTGADLRGADLNGAKLYRVDLTGSKLYRADLTGAFLFEADLTKAYLTYAKGLTVDRLLKAKTLYKVKGLPPEIEKKLRDKKPELFDSPFKN